jgi:hypothetical protein
VTEQPPDERSRPSHERDHHRRDDQQRGERLELGGRADLEGDQHGQRQDEEPQPVLGHVAVGELRDAVVGEPLLDLFAQLRFRVAVRRLARRVLVDQHGVPPRRPVVTDELQYAGRMSRVNPFLRMIQPSVPNITS